MGGHAMTQLSTECERLSAYLSTWVRVRVGATVYRFDPRHTAGLRKGDVVRANGLVGVLL